MFWGSKKKEEVKVKEINAEDFQKKVKAAMEGAPLLVSAIGTYLEAKKDHIASTHLSQLAPQIDQLIKDILATKERFENIADGGDGNLSESDANDLSNAAGEYISTMNKLLAHMQLFKKYVEVFESLNSNNNKNA